MGLSTSLPIRGVRILVASASLALAMPSGVKANSTATRVAANQLSLGPQSPPSASTDLARIRELERRNAILEAMSELEERANSRLEHYLGAFGILLTIVALAFGLSTKESAVAAARRGIEEEAQSVKALLRTARSLLDEMERHAADAEAIKNRMAEQIQPSGPHRIEGTATAAEGDSESAGYSTEEAAEISESDRSSMDKLSYDDLNRRVHEAEKSGDWQRVVDLSIECRRAHKKNAQIAEMLFSEAFARRRLGQFKKSLDLYERSIKRLSKESYSRARAAEAQARLNAALLYNDLGNPRREIEKYSELISKFESDTSLDVRHIVAQALINKAVEVGRAGNLDEAVELNKRVIRDYGNIDDERFIKQVKMATSYNARRGA